VAQEHTSTSPSNRHLGHIRAFFSVQLPTRTPIPYKYCVLTTPHHAPSSVSPCLSLWALVCSADLEVMFKKYPGRPPLIQRLHYASYGMPCEAVRFQLVYLQLTYAGQILTSRPRTTQKTTSTNLAKAEQGFSRPGRTHCPRYRQYNRKALAHRKTFTPVSRKQLVSAPLTTAQKAVMIVASHRSASAHQFESQQLRTRLSQNGMHGNLSKGIRICTMYYLSLSRLFAKFLTYHLVTSSITRTTTSSGSMVLHS
jgi:hypothetical protein